MERSWPGRLWSQGVLSRLEMGALLLVYLSTAIQYAAAWPGLSQSQHETLGSLGPTPAQERKAHGRASSSVKTRGT